MNKKYIVILAVVVFIALFAAYYFFRQNSENVVEEKNNNIAVEQKENNTDESVVAEENSQNNKKDSEKKNEIVQKAQIQKDELGSDLKINNSIINSNSLPLSAISVISKLPKNIQEKVSRISDNSNIYSVQNINNKILIINDNPDNIRHSIEFTEISVPNGHEVRTTLGYNDKMKDSNNDIWEYNEETKQPTRHTKYNTDGDMEFVEVWNYDDNPIKYEMKNSDGKVISIRKETLQGDSDLRVEHLIYDLDGNIKVNVSVTFDGSDVKRFTYYNADKINESGSVFSEYSSDGSKTKETVYSSDFKLQNTYVSEYSNGERSDIVILDKNNKEVQTIKPVK